MSVCMMCMWYEQCGSLEPCEDFDPVEQDFDDAIQRARELFMDEWNEYIQDDYL